MSSIIDSRMMNLGTGLSSTSGVLDTTNKHLLKNILVTEATAMVLLNNLPLTGYENFEIFITNYRPMTGTSPLHMQISGDNGATFLNTNVYYHVGLARGGDNSTSNVASASTGIGVVGTQTTSTTVFWGNSRTLIGRNQIGVWTAESTCFGSGSTGTVAVGIWNWIFLNTTSFNSEPNAFRLYCSGGQNITPGMRVQIWGIPRGA